MYKIKMNDARQKDMEDEPGCCLNGRLPPIEIDVVPSKDSLVNRIKGNCKNILQLLRNRSKITLTRLQINYRL